MGSDRASKKVELKSEGRRMWDPGRTSLTKEGPVSQAAQSDVSKRRPTAGDGYCAGEEAQES